jgi:hypothetical protein
LDQKRRSIGEEKVDAGKDYDGMAGYYRSELMV